MSVPSSIQAPRPRPMSLADIKPGFQAPIYADDKPVLLMDGSDPSDMRWTGANPATMRLLRCLEPVRDLKGLIELLVILPGGCNKRVVKSLSVPLHTLAERTQSWFNAMSLRGSDCRLESKPERQQIREKLKRLLDSGMLKELTPIRDKIGAHIDEEAVVYPDKYWTKVDLATFLEWVQLLMMVLGETLNLDIYGWNKLGGPDHIWELMTVDGTLVELLMENGQPTMILSVTFVESPRLVVLRELQRLYDSASQLRRLASSSPEKHQGEGGP